MNKWSHSALFVLVAVVLMFLAGVTELGASILGVPALGWVFFSLTAWLLSMLPV